MPVFKTASLGDVLQTAETIKGMQRQAENDKIRNAYLGQETQSMVANQAAKQAADAQAQAAKDAATSAARAYHVADAVFRSDHPASSVQNLAPDFVQQYEQQNGPGSFGKLNDEQVRGIFGPVREKAMVAAGIQPKYSAPIAGQQNGQPVFFQTDETGTPRALPGGFTPPPKKAPGATGGALGGFDDPKIQDLQAAFAAAGYSLPAGFRSKEQQLGLLRGLLKKYDGLTADDIAHLAASHAIDYKAVGKATQAAAAMGGRVEVANNELAAFVPIAQEASANVDRGSFVPFNRLKQAGQAAISDPDLKRLYVSTQAVLNAYDVLAARGGTDQKKRAENHAMLENADGPEAYNAALQMILREGSAAGGATRNAMKASAFGYPGGQSDQAPTPSARLSPEDAAKLPSGTQFIGLDGVPRIKH